MVGKHWARTIHTGEKILARQRKLVIIFQKNHTLELELVYEKAAILFFSRFNYDSIVCYYSKLQ